MKRLFIVLALLFCVLSIPIVMVNAEETESPEEVEVVTQKEEVEEWINRFFSPEKVAMYLSWIAYIGTIIGLVVKLKQLKNANQLTLEKVTALITKSVENITEKSVKEQVERFLPNIVNTQEKTNDILKGFSKVLALSQENTPESRVAILKVIEELGTSSKELVENAKEVIEKEVELTKEHKEEIETKLDNIIKEYDGTSI